MAHVLKCKFTCPPLMRLSYDVGLRRSGLPCTAWRQRQLHCTRTLSKPASSTNDQNESNTPTPTTDATEPAGVREADQAKQTITETETQTQPLVSSSGRLRTKFEGWLPYKDVEKPTQDGASLSEHATQIPDKMYEIRKLQLSRRRGLSPSERLSAMLPDNFWQSQTPESKQSVSMLDDQAKSAEAVSVKQSPPEGATPSTVLHHVSMKPLQYKELVVVGMEKKTVTHKALTCLIPEGRFSHKAYGRIGHRDIVGRTEFTRMRTGRKRDVVFSRPTLEEYLRLVHHKTKVPYPKVLSAAFAHVAVGPGDRVLEAGSGSGTSALIISSLAGSEGSVHSVERDHVHHHVAQANFNTWYNSYNSSHEVSWPGNVTFHRIDFTHFRPDQPFDMVFLDVANVEEATLIAVRHLKLGKTIAVYSPSISKIVDIAVAILEQNPPLELENVWELTDRQWLTRVHDDMSHSVSTPRNNEVATVFLAKFRKCSRDLNVAAQTDQRLLREGDEVMIVAMAKPKENASRSRIFTLQPGHQHFNQWGGLSHDLALGQPEGLILETSTGREVYICRPSLTEYLDQVCHNMAFQPAQLSLASHLLAANPGDCVMEIGKDPKQTSVLSLVLSQAVMKQGQVHLLTWQWEEDIWVKVDVQDLVSSIKKQRPDWLGGQMHFHSMQTPGKLPDSLSNTMLDGICVTYLPTPNTLQALQASLKLLKQGGYVCFLLKRIFEVQQTLDCIHQHRLPLVLVDIHEDRDREWILRAPRARQNIELGLFPRPAICRPKQQGNDSTAFIVRLRKRPALEPQDLLEDTG